MELAFLRMELLLRGTVTLGLLSLALYPEVTRILCCSSSLIPTLWTRRVT
jgi:hypothetical protein